MPQKPHHRRARALSLQIALPRSVSMIRAPRLAGTYQDSEARAGRHAQGHHLDHRAIVARRSVSRRHRKPQGSSCLPRSSSKNHLSAEGVRFAFAGRPKPAVQPAAWIPPSQTKGFNAGTAPPARASARRLAERRFPRLWRWYPPLRRYCLRRECARTSRALPQPLRGSRDWRK